MFEISLPPWLNLHYKYVMNIIYIYIAGCYSVPLVEYGTKILVLGAECCSPPEPAPMDPQLNKPSQGCNPIQ